MNFAPDQLPSLSGEIGYTVLALDAAGNSATLVGTFEVDLLAPAAPDITAYLIDFSNLLGIRVEAGESPFDLATIDSSGLVQELGFDVTYNARGDFYSYDFAQAVPDGTYLVITDQDSAGNTASTLLIVDATGSVPVDLAREGIDGFDIGMIDLSLAPQAQLSLDAAQILALTGTGQPLLVRGDASDQVVLSGAEDAGQTTVIGGHSYSLYTLGDYGAQVWLDDTISGVTL